jgi:hypothetical protein
VSAPRAFKCPSCGANPKLDGAGRPLPCEYCGTQLVVSPTNAAEQAGDDDENAIEIEAASVENEAEPPAAHASGAQSLVRFRVTEEQARAHLLEWGTWWMGPRGFARSAKLEVRRMWLPYWVIVRPGPLPSEFLPAFRFKPGRIARELLPFPLDEVVPYQHQEIAGASVEPCVVKPSERVHKTRCVLLPAWWIRYGGTEKMPWVALINGVTGQPAGMRPMGPLAAWIVFGLVLFFLFLMLFAAL